MRRILSISHIQPQSIICLILAFPVLYQIGIESSSAASRTQLTRSNKVNFDDIIFHGKKFNITSRDLIVLLHIQKTGGTSFEKHLVGNLAIERPCSCNTDKRRCSCPRPNSAERVNKTFVESTWLLSRFSTGWLCGLHPDWGSLDSCLSSLDRLYLVTFLRNPIERFISEFRHVQRGATWKTSKSHCKVFDTQSCYKGKQDWSNVTIEEFVACKTNMAFNRQTRMLADPDLYSCPVNAQTVSDHERALLSSAMDNLRRLAFFGLCEEQRASQILFEQTFNLIFNNSFAQSEDNKTKLVLDTIPFDIRRKIVEMNHLDMDLYRFAVKLFWSRLDLLDRSNLSIR